MSSSTSIFKRTLTSPSGLIGLIILVSILCMALLAPQLFPKGPWGMVARPYIWPGKNLNVPLGTDVMGRDMLAGIFYGARVSLLVGFVAATVALLIGVTVGALSGYYGRIIDTVLMRITDAFQTIPSFLFAIVIVAILSPSITTIVCAIALVSWPSIARLMRAEVLRVREMEFVQSCKVIGMSDARIILTQIIPNSLSPVIVAASVLVATAIITEAGLAFLGLGDPNIISWGSIINVGRPSIRTSWYIALIPGGFVVLTVLALNLLGDAINDAINPRLRRR